MTTAIDFNEFGKHFLPGHLGIEIVAVEKEKAITRMKLGSHYFAPNNYVHAGSIVTLADTIAGYGCIYNLPENGKSFTTVELKSNFSGAVKNGVLLATATLQHVGKTTQIWDVIVNDEATTKQLALFRCTQLILY